MAATTFPLKPIHLSTSFTAFLQAPRRGKELTGCFETIPYRYSGNSAGVWRMDLRDGKIDALIDVGYPPRSDRHFFGRDDQYLYWADSSHDRVVRWKR